MNARRPRVLVAGGSIGGLTAALVLSDIGCDVLVFERASAALEERGAGIVVLPMTERYFVTRGIPRVSLELPWWKYVDRRGDVISADLDRYRFSGWNTLYRGLLEAFDPDRYHLASEMVSFAQTGDGVVLELADGRQIEGDLLVCADGFGSTGRSILLPEIGPEYAGYVAWRGVAHASALPGWVGEALSDSMVYQVLDDGHLLVYAIPGPEGPASGERLLNFVWYRNYPEGSAFGDIMTDADGEVRPSTVPPGMIRPEHLEELHATADEVLAPLLREVVHGAEQILIQAIFDLESPRLAFGRVCLIGDAAFVARPHLAAGQAKACADAWALADAVASHPDDVEAALRAWEPGQLALGRRVVGRSREMGRMSQTGRMRPGDPTWKFGLAEVEV
jgi:2,6-dihydroxypyridine 3-monooxygenase